MPENEFLDRRKTVTDNVGCILDEIWREKSNQNVETSPRLIRSRHLLKSCATNVPPQGSAYEGWRIMYAHSLTSGYVDIVVTPNAFSSIYTFIAIA